MLHLTYDATTDVAYLEFRQTGPSDLLGPALLLEPDPEFAGTVIADFTRANARLVGLEFLRASACLPADLLASAQRIDGEHLARRVEARTIRALGRPAAAREAKRDAVH